MRVEPTAGAASFVDDPGHVAWVAAPPNKYPPFEAPATTAVRAP